MNYIYCKTKASGDFVRRCIHRIESRLGYKLPSIVEITIAILYLVAWLSPVIASWGVAKLGLRFSLVAPERQNQNIDIVGICILVALASGVVAALVAMTYLRKISKPYLSNMGIGRLESAQRFVLFGIMLIAGYGLYRSFGGTLFEKGYEGASVVWLGYGAWSVTFLFALSMLVGDFLSSRPFHIAIIFAMTLIAPVIFVPFLLSGSRIDFLAFMLVLAACVLVLHEMKFKIRVLGAFTILAWATVVSALVGNARYTVSDPALTFQVAMPMKMIKTEIKTDMRNQADTFYLSTIGDLGASVFQIVGLIHEKADRVVGIAPALQTYATRLLPGSFFTDRPGDLWTQLPEGIGGGALHALGEGYLIFGLWGCAFVGAVFGILIAISIFAGKQFRTSSTYLSWIMFALPWLLLIRGGWYQFFAIFKSIEILLLLLLLLMSVAWVSKTLTRGKERACL